MNKVTIHDWREGHIGQEWYASLLSTGRKGGSVIHFLHHPTRRFADGRDEGLTALKLDAEADFLDWFRERYDYLENLEKCIIVLD